MAEPSEMEGAAVQAMWAAEDERDTALSRIKELEAALRGMLEADDRSCKFWAEEPCECDTCQTARALLAEIDTASSSPTDEAERRGEDG